MPKIDLGYGQVGTQTLTPQRGLTDVSGLGAEVDALSRLATTAATTFADIQQNRENVQMAKAATDFAKEIESKEFEFKNEDTDFQTQDARYQEFIQERYQHYEKQFDNPRLFDQFKQSTDKFVFDKGLNIKSSSLRNNALEQQAILDSTLSDISGLAIRGNQEQFDESVQKAKGLIDHAHDIGVLDTAEKEAATRKFNNGLSRGKVRQDINLDPANALENIRENKYANLSPEEQSQFESMALSKMAQTKQRAEAQASKQASELVSDTILALNNGYIVEDEEIASARAGSVLIGKQEDLEIAIASSKFVTLPKHVRDGLPSGLKGVKNAELRDALEHANEVIERGLDKDGYAFAVEQRVIDQVPIDLTDPSTIQARLEQVEYLRQHYGRPVSPLTEPEADMLIEALSVMTPKDKVSIAQTLGASEAVWSQLDKKNAGLFSMTGAIGDAQVMENVFKGQQMIKDKLAPMVSQKDYLPAFNDYVDDIYSGKDRRQMLDATLAHYAATTKSETFDSGDFEDSIEAVSGGIGRINGSKIELPRGIEEDDFEDFIDNISPDTIRDMGGVWSLRDDQASEIVRNAKIVSYATNQYMVVVNDAVLMSKDGMSPFLISYDEELKERDKPQTGPQRRERER